MNLIAELEKTMNSYLSKTAKDDVRKLLVAYGNAIVEVIKERQNEINSLHGCGADSGIFEIQVYFRSHDEHETNFPINIDTNLWNNFGNEAIYWPIVEKIGLNLYSPRKFWRVVESNRDLVFCTCEKHL